MPEWWNKLRRTTNASDDQPLSPAPHRAERYVELKNDFAANMFTPAHPAELEHYKGGMLLLYQLALGEKLVQNGRLDAHSYAERLDNAFIWGYIFGVAAFLIEGAGWPRESREADGLVIRLHQEVWGAVAAAEIARRSARALESPSFTTGMSRGAQDAQSIGTDEPTVGAASFLANGVPT